MNKKIWIIVAFVIVAVGIWKTQNFIKESHRSHNNIIEEKNSETYWTCPMHPQIHMEHEGECPICHMKLVKVTKQITEGNHLNDDAQRSDVLISSSQSQLLGLQKQEVEKMNLTVSIPVSGHILSPTSVAFQIYEDDLRYIHTGLKFAGEGTGSSDDPISGVISSVDTIADPTSRTVRVVGRIQNAPHGLIPETSFRGEIKIELKDHIAIPESSVLHTGNGDLVYLFKENNKLAAQKIKLGIKAEGFYEVLSGLEVGQFISAGPNFLIDSEAKIRGASEDNLEKKTPQCPPDQHWDFSMSMCMPGKANQ